MKHTKRIVLIFFTIIVAIGSITLMPQHSIALASNSDAKIESWAESHPLAASELKEWMITHREGAQAIIKWESNHPEQLRTFVTWVVTHLGIKVDVFLEEHADWRRFIRMVESHHEDINEFVVWCRFHPKATTELIQHPRALHWFEKQVN